MHHRYWKKRNTTRYVHFSVCSTSAYGLFRTESTPNIIYSEKGRQRKYLKRRTVVKKNRYSTTKSTSLRARTGLSIFSVSLVPIFFTNTHLRATGWRLQSSARGHYGTVELYWINTKRDAFLRRQRSRNAQQERVHEQQSNHYPHAPQPPAYQLGISQFTRCNFREPPVPLH